MLPVLQIGKFKIMTFPCILLLAFFVCLIAMIFIEKYQYEYLISVQRMFLSVLVMSGIGGKTLYLISMLCQGEKEYLHLINGFVFYGGLIGAFIGIVMWCKKHHKNILIYTDIFVSVLPLGQAVGRIGCYFNGCCYGKNYNGILAVEYIIEGKKCKVFPTWFIEAGVCLMIYVAMHFINKEMEGLKTAIYIMVYAVSRFIIEFYRGDEIRGIWGYVSTSQIVSLCFMGIAIILIQAVVCIRKRGYREW